MLGGTGNVEVTPVLSSEAKTASFNTNWFKVAQLRALYWYLNIEAVSGTTPFLLGKVQGAHTVTSGVAVGTISDLGTLVSGSVVANFRKPLLDSDFDRYTRVAFTITGTTPSFTLSNWWAGRS